MFFLAKIGVVTPSMLAKNRRFAIVVAFVLGAMITPTIDPVKQALVALPVMAMYEAGIWLAKLGRRGRRRAAQQLEAESQEV